MNQVRVAKVRDDPRFVEEHFDGTPLEREVRQKPFDDDRPLEAEGALNAPEKDLAHASGRQTSDDVVPADATWALASHARSATVSRENRVEQTGLR
jgi:hypothetical protein